MQGQAAAELDDVVGDNGNADPALHPFEPSIPAAIQSVAPLQHANAAFASGLPALPGPEPTRSSIKSSQNVHANRDYLRTLKRKVLVNLVFQMFASGIVCLKHEGFH